MQRLGMEEGVPIEHKMVTKAIERAQKQVEAQHFSVRKHLLEYDDVMNKQRESVYLLRRELLEGQIHLTKEEVVNSREYIMALAEELLDSHVNSCCGQEIDIEEWDIQGLKQTLTALFALEPSDYQNIDFSSINQDELYEELWSRVASRYKEKESIVPQDVLRRVERDVMLQIVDAQWKDHLYSLDHLKEGIGLRGYGQRNPLVEYKKESFGYLEKQISVDSFINNLYVGLFNEDLTPLKIQAKRDKGDVYDVTYSKKVDSVEVISDKPINWSLNDNNLLRFYKPPLYEDSSLVVVDAFDGFKIKKTDSFYVSFLGNQTRKLQFNVGVSWSSQNIDDTVSFIMDFNFNCDNLLSRVVW